jgi:type IV pilus assembly protein PilN
VIRINLLATEKERAKKRVMPFASANSKITVGCSLILLAAATFSGTRYYTVNKESSTLDRQITDAQQETSRLHSIIQQVQQFEQRRAQLQQRVVLIEQLRKGQTGPVHMLDQISKAIPPMLWLTELKQVGNDTLIDGKCTTLTGLSDFAANLEATGYFKKSVEIVSTQTETISQPPGQLIKFTVKAQFLTPAPPKANETGKAGPAANARGAKAGA